jgi:DNA-binding ferritin-like protein
MAQLDMEKCCKVFEDDKYCLLAVFLAYTEALQMVHHSHHWQTKGNLFYQDHLLYERLYTGILEEIDTVGEKLIGLSKEPKLTNYFARMTVMRHFLEACTDSKKPYIEVSLLSEKMFLSAGEKIMKDLKKKGLLTSGLEQMIGNILDKHEGFIYLLQQRVNSK